MNTYFLGLLSGFKSQNPMKRDDGTEGWTKIVGNKSYHLFDVGDIFSFSRKKVTIEVFHGLNSWFKLIIWMALHKSPSELIMVTKTSR